MISEGGSEADDFLQVLAGRAKVDAIRISNLPHLQTPQQDNNNYSQQQSLCEAFRAMESTLKYMIR